MLARRQGVWSRRGCGKLPVLICLLPITGYAANFEEEKAMNAATVALSFLLSIPCAAKDKPTDKFDAMALYKVCSVAAQQSDEADMACATYMRGITDAAWVMQLLANEHKRTCLPKDSPISVSEARRIFKEWIDAHPDAGGHSAGLVATTALLHAHRCPN
jgi:Ssp1 endopeptidase immunity protein Rap1a